MLTVTVAGFVGLAVGGGIMAVFSARAYEKGFRDGASDAVRRVLRQAERRFGPGVRR